MKTLNLKRVHEILNLLSNKQDIQSEYEVYVFLLGGQSEYSEMHFESFLNYYSFKFIDDVLEVYNNDGIPWEDYNNEDYSRIPLISLEMSDSEINEWAEKEIEKQIQQQKENKLAEIESKKLEITRLQKEIDEKN